MIIDVVRKISVTVLVVTSIALLASISHVFSGAPLPRARSSQDPHRSLTAVKAGSSMVLSSSPPKAAEVALRRASLAKRGWRLMLVGDSITEGIAPGSKRRFRVPAEGSCSYRFLLLRHLHMRNPDFLFETVGPFDGAFGGGAVAAGCCLGGVSPAVAALHHPPISSESDCIQAYGRHAALWGSQSPQFLSNSLSELVEFRRSLVRLYFKSRHINVSPKWVDDAIGKNVASPLADNTDDVVIDQSVPTTVPSAVESAAGLNFLQRWSSGHHPDAVIILFGTNDVYSSATPMDMMVVHYPHMLRSVLQASASTSKMRVAVCTLLPRVAFEMQAMNELLLRVRSCKRLKQTCMACVLSVIGITNSTESGVGVWCKNEVFILNVGGNTTMLNRSAEVLYDGVHPSSVGEAAIAAVMTDEIMNERFFEE